MMDYADKLEQMATQSQVASDQPQSSMPPPQAPAMQPMGTQQPVAPKQSGVDYASRLDEMLTQQQLKSLDIDRGTGAPADVRLAVGSAVTPEDKLATLRKTYPDAQRLGADNFAFTDPTTGRPTQLNPKGFDLGDIAGAAPEIGEFVGGLVGGLGGAAVGNVPGAIAGSGIGSAAGRGLVQQGAEWLLGTEDTRTAGEQAADLAVTGGLGALGTGVAPYIAKAGGALVRPVTSKFVNRTPAELVDDYAQMGVTPLAGQASQNRAIQTTESMLGNTPGGAPVMQEAIERQQGQLQDAVSKVIGTTGGRALTAEQLGDLGQSGIKAGAQRVKDQSSKLYEKAYDEIGRDTPMALNNVSALRSELAQQIAEAPSSTPGYLKQVSSQIDDILTDAQGPQGLSFAAGRRLQGEINNLAKTLPEMGNPAQGIQKRLASALKADMGETVESVGGRASKLYGQAQRYNAKRVQANKGFVNTALKDSKTAEKFGKTLLSPSPDPQTLRQARQMMTSDEWNDVAASTIQRMGKATPGQQGAEGDIFSANTFLTNWNKMSPDAKKELFGGARYKDTRQALDQLSRVTSSIKEGNKMANPSGTARHLAYMGLLGAVGAGVGGGEPGSIAGTVAAGIVAPKVAAKLITSPRFVKWVSKTPKQKNQRDIAKHLSQLYMIAEVNPDIREEVQQFIRATQNITSG